MDGRGTSSSNNFLLRNQYASALYPIPKGSEKGYGLYKCSECGDKWGSSRAVGNIGQQCLRCAEAGKVSLIPPFRIEVPKKKRYARRTYKRVPKEPILEDEVDKREYGEADRLRNSSSAGNALLRGETDENSERSYEFVAPEDY